MHTRLIGTELSKANLTNCRIFAISAWGINTEEFYTKNLIITEPSEPVITVDNLEVAQFIYLLIYNQKLREVIDTITSKAVLILGRFTDERKAVLDAIREELRKKNYIPILFDFDKPASRDLTETITTLAHLSRFVIADMTDPNSIPHELATIVPHLRHVAIQPIMLKGRREYPMFKDFRESYRWVLKTHEYESQDQLIAELVAKVIEPAEAKVNELRPTTK